jgi:hypothetical protein
MGYDIHIHKAEDWTRSAERAISPEEWLAAVAGDPELRLDAENGPYFAVWSGPRSSADGAWFDWIEGRVFTKSPDRATLTKMLRLAGRLGAKVQGDEGEFYDSPEDLPADDRSDTPAPPRKQPWWRFW